MHKRLAIYLIILLFSMTTYARDLAIGGRVSNLGLGAELTIGLTETINARVNLSGFNADDDFTENDIDYKADLELRSLGANIDWHPFRNGFRVTGGLLINNSSMDLEAGGSGLVEIGDDTYDLDNLSIDGDIELGNNVVPYLGVGFGNAVHSNRRWGFNADVGVAFTGSPEVDLDGSVDDPSALPPGVTEDDFQDDVKKEEDDIQDELDDINVVPVISIGVSYKF